MISIMLLLPFDSHNHIHLGSHPLSFLTGDAPPPPSSLSKPPFLWVSELAEQEQQEAITTSSTTETTTDSSGPVPFSLSSFLLSLTQQQERRQPPQPQPQQPDETENHELQQEINPVISLSLSSSSSHNHDDDDDMIYMSGMAIMSTNINDFMIVKQLAHDLMMMHQQRKRKSSLLRSSSSFHVIACYGIHPWWLHELIREHELWEVYPTSNSHHNHHHHHEHSDIDNNSHISKMNHNADCDLDTSHTIPNFSQFPMWVHQLKDALIDTPNSVIGEIGLDGYHYDPITKELSCSISNQMIAFRYQMIVGYLLQRPVCIHCVQCYGPLLSMVYHRNYIFMHLVVKLVPSIKLLLL
jgi:Tat protein secretion system quality control protein TatD with DNase activity